MLGTTLWEKVDLVLSGINIGTNLGNAIWHSGTLAGAKQAALLGLHGIVWARQSLRHYDGKVVPAKDPMGRTHYWFTVVPVEATEEGTDRRGIEQGYVSMTPLRLDLTDHDKLAEARKLESWKKIKFA